MSLKKVYLKGIAQVISGELTKEELWDIFAENLKDRGKRADKLERSLKNLKIEHKLLLEGINKVHEDYKEN